jgi:hypothetical protein
MVVQYRTLRYTEVAAEEGDGYYGFTPGYTRVVKKLIRSLISTS